MYLYKNYDDIYDNINMSSVNVAKTLHFITLI